jgi:hypothetical protein
MGWNPVPKDGTFQAPGSHPVKLDGTFQATGGHDYYFINVDYFIVHIF